MMAEAVGVLPLLDCFCRCYFAILAITIFVIAIAVFAITDDVNRIVIGNARVAKNLELRAKPSLVTRAIEVLVFGASPDSYLLVVFLDVRQFIRSLLTSAACRRLMRSQNLTEKMRTLADRRIIKNFVIAERARFAI